MDRDTAESVAIITLSYLAGDSERLGRFLALTGISPARIRKVAREPGFLAAVLEHVLADERLLLGASRQAGREPSEFAQAREALASRQWERDIP